jgi:hypothetical protein
MTEDGEELKGPLAERITAHMKRVDGLLRHVDPCRGSNGDASAEMLRPEKRIDGTLRFQLSSGPRDREKGSSTVFYGRGEPSISSRDSVDHSELRSS